jgi:hypothetical protein
MRHNAGAAYISAALAYGWQDVTTTVPSPPPVPITCAQRSTPTHSPGVRRRLSFCHVVGRRRRPHDLRGGSGHHLRSAGLCRRRALRRQHVCACLWCKERHDTRSELGIHTDKSFAVEDAILTLRGRAVWAHDFDPDRSIGATFQTLPGASFGVNGAVQASDSALVTASAEMKWMNGWSAAATFEGEFSDVTESYAGKGVVRYAW